MNLATVIVASIIVAVVVTIVVQGIRNKKKGKTSCSCGGNCGACDLCHSKK